MDSLVDEDEVVASSADNCRDREGSNKGIMTVSKGLERTETNSSSSLSLPRAANGTVVFTSVSSPSNPGTKQGTVSQAIAVPQPGGAVSIVQLQLPNQSNVVQSVIQPPNQQSVIQATGGAATVQTVQLSKNLILLNKVGQGSVIQSTEHNDINQAHSVQLVSATRSNQPESVIATPNAIEDESKKRREVLARRPSYRKILNDLSSADVGSVASIPEIKNEEETETDSGTATITVAGSYLKVVPASTIQLATGNQDGTFQGIPTLTMTNATSGGNAIVQYATQGQDGQFFVPVTVSAADLQAYQLRTSGTGASTGVSQGVVMSTPTNIPLPHNPNAEEAAKKRELRLLKNREAAKECRRKKKEYIKCLENRVAVLENQNKALIEELKSLKELYCQKE